MSLENLIGQIVRVKDRHVVGKKRSALLLAVSRDGSIGYLRTRKGGKLQACGDQILPMAYGVELAATWPPLR